MFGIMGIAWYTINVIKSFRDSDTKKIFEYEYCKMLSRDIQKIAFRKLHMVDSVKILQDLFYPPGNRLEKLTGNRDGQYSIRINNKYRLCFEWHDGDANNVEIIDYH